jgi:hypothetical protein
MGIKFGREYGEIIDDFTKALSNIGDLYTCFEMSEADWRQLEEEERDDCVRTLADDVFYGLGTEGSLAVGSGTVSHDAERHVLKVHSQPDITAIVYLT